MRGSGRGGGGGGGGGSGGGRGFLLQKSNEAGDAILLGRRCVDLDLFWSWKRVSPNTRAVALGRKGSKATFDLETAVGRFDRWTYE